jgi:heterodisulfide reductase subunit D
MNQLDVVQLGVSPSPGLRAAQQLVSSCIQCGTCSSTCPTAPAMDYTPRHLWRMVEAGLTDEVLNSSAFWFCTSCYACTNQCPRGIHPGETMLRLKQAVAEGEGGVMPENMAHFGHTVVEYHNISAEPNDTRLIWMENLAERERPTGRVGRRDAKVLYFVGCVSSFYPASYHIPQAFVQTMGRAGVDFTMLGGEEWCCGYPLLNAGMIDEMAKVAEYSLDKAHELGVERVVMTCPSCYHAWHNVYPELLGRPLDIEVAHAVQLLAELVEENRIDLGPLEKKVTYHDPCDLGRKGGIYDAPRFVLEHIPGVEFIEMRDHGPNAACCGGGGNLEAIEPTLVNRVAEARMVQAAETGAEVVASACQQCKRTLFSAARRTKTRVRALDITELVWDAMQAAEQG